MLDQNGSYDSRVKGMVKAARQNKMQKGISELAAKIKPKSKMLGKSGISKGRARLVDQDNPTNPQAQGYGGKGIQ